MSIDVRRRPIELFACHQPAHYVQSGEYYTSIPNLRGELHRVKCPMLGICGTDDPSRDRPEILQNVADFRQQWIKGARRFTMMEYPSEFDEMVDAFLATL